MGSSPRWSYPVGGHANRVSTSQLEHTDCEAHTSTCHLHPWFSLFRPHLDTYCLCKLDNQHPVAIRQSAWKMVIFSLKNKKEAHL